jgi:hypothetical protein
MPLDPDRIEELVRDIEAAFGHLDPPGDDKLLHPRCFDDMDIEAFYGAPHWRDVAPEIIGHENAALCFFSPEGFQFYLPAYMTWSLRHYESGSASVLHTLYSLDPGMWSGELRAFQLSKFELLTPEQRKTIVAFLDLFQDDEDLADLAENALENYWGRRDLKP